MPSSNRFRNIIWQAYLLYRVSPPHPFVRCCHTSSESTDCQYYTCQGASQDPRNFTGKYQRLKRSKLAQIVPDRASTQCTRRSGKGSNAHVRPSRVCISQFVAGAYESIECEDESFCALSMTTDTNRVPRKPRRGDSRPACHALMQKIRKWKSTMPKIGRISTRAYPAVLGPTLRSALVGDPVPALWLRWPRRPLDFSLIVLRLP